MLVSDVDDSDLNWFWGIGWTGCEELSLVLPITFSRRWNVMYMCFDFENVCPLHC